jgi:hypothetical protein
MDQFNDFITSPNAVNFSGGVGDVLTFGLTQGARGLWDIGTVDTSAGSYYAGEAAGVVGSLGVGWIAGTKAAVSGYANFSHSLIPHAKLKNQYEQTGSRFVRWLDRRGNRLNGDYIPWLQHAVMDPKAYRRLRPALKAIYEEWGTFRQTINRLPYMWGSALYGGGAVATNELYEE